MSSFCGHTAIRQSTEAVSEGVLDLIGLHAEDLGPDAVQRLINKAIKHGLAPVRQAAYRIGAEQFGLDFARPALKDDGLVRDGRQAIGDEKTPAGSQDHIQAADSSSPA